MTVWLGIILLSLFCMLLIVWAGNKNIKVTRSDPIAFYKAQLAEIEADIDTTMISKEDADTASLEIKRRIISTGDELRKDYTENSGGWLYYGLGALIIVGSILLYTIVGAPEIASAPYRVPEVMERKITAGNELTFKQAISQIRQRLEQAPNDVKGWEILANTLAGIGRYSEAAEAYSHAAALSPNNASYFLKLGEQITAMHGGQVVPAARNSFQKVLKISPNHASAQYYLGLGQKQAGNKENARRIWQRLVDNSAPDAPWLATVRQQIANLNPAPRSFAGPTRDDMQAVQNMSKEDQAAFIDSMIERLKAKLEKNPQDAKGWLMLARSEETRGNIKGAIEALAEGLKSVSDEDKDPLGLYLEKLKS